MSTEPDEERVLLLAPVGRDAPLLRTALRQAAFSCQVVADAQELRLGLREAAGTLLLTEEALTPQVLHLLQAFLAAQATWSNLPLVLLVDEPKLASLRRTLLEVLGAESQLTLLARPVSAPTLVAVLQAALWARRRQYEVRALLRQLAFQNETLAREVLERQLAERRLQELNVTLEQRVEERTAELELRNRELDQFAYVASHDLKAPLRNINLLASWTVEDAGESLPPAAQQHLVKLRGRIRRMEKLLDDLLAYSRAGRQHYSPECVDIATLVHNVVEVLNPPPGFMVTLAEAMPVVVTERVPLETVLRNLLGNAFKHHPNPTAGEVIVAAQVQDAWVEFTVADNGAGIDPSFHTRIFEIFQTLQPRDQVEGSGIGLSVVKKLVENRGGRVQVTSSIGEGTTFRFTWPITAVSEAADG
jgi:signal transduction histidine kinase